MQFIRYTLQSIASGASFLNLMAWSQACFGGYCFDSSLLNTLANWRYSVGTSTFFVNCCALMASSVEVVAHVLQLSCDPLTRAIIGSFPGRKGLTDRRIIGSSFSLITPFFHVNWGSNAAIHGYPSMTSSFPMFVIRNCIVFLTPLVCMSRVT